MQNTSTIQKPNTPNRKRGNDRKLSSRIRNIKLSKKQILALALGVALLIVSVSQLERLSSEGTLFGYQVKDIAGVKESNTKKAKSGSVVDVSKLPDGSYNEACKILTLEDIRSFRKAEFKQSAGLVPDTKEPLLSTCIYSTKSQDGTFEMVSILLRSKENSDSAKKLISSLRQQDEGEDISGLGDEAYFNRKANQLTIRIDSRLVTITHSSSKEDLDTKSITVELAKKMNF